MNTTNYRLSLLALVIAFTVTIASYADEDTADTPLQCVRIELITTNATTQWMLYDKAMSLDAIGESLSTMVLDKQPLVFLIVGPDVPTSRLADTLDALNRVGVEAPVTLFRNSSHLNVIKLGEADYLWKSFHDLIEQAGAAYPPQGVGSADP